MKVYWPGVVLWLVVLAGGAALLARPDAIVLRLLVWSAVVLLAVLVLTRITRGGRREP